MFNLSHTTYLYVVSVYYNNPNLPYARFVIGTAEARRQMSHPG